MFSYSGEKVIDQCGFTAADIDDGCRASRSCLFYERKGRLKVWAVPADFARSFLCVDLFPMSLYVHTDQRICIEVLSMISESQTCGAETLVLNGKDEFRAHRRQFAH